MKKIVITAILTLCIFSGCSSKKPVPAETETSIETEKPAETETETETQKDYLAAPAPLSIENQKKGVWVEWEEVEGALDYQVYRKVEDGDWEYVSEIAASHYIDYNVSNGKEYAYIAFSEDEEGDYLEDFENSKPLQIVYYDMPGKITVKSALKGVKISWKANKLAKSYQVYRLNDKLEWESIGTTEKTKFVDKKVKTLSEYKYAVACYDSEKKEDISAFDENGALIQYVAAPKNVSFTNTEKGVKITWKDKSPSGAYKLYWKSGDQWVEMATVNGQYYLDTEVTSGKTYTYNVACAAQDGKTLLSAYKKEGFSHKYVGMPTGFKLENTVEGVRFTWNEVAGADKYFVYKTGSDGSYTRIASTKSASYTDKDVKGGEKYTYTVRCVSEDEKEFTSAYNKNGETIQYFECPGNIKAVYAGTGIDISWSESKGASAYRVYRKTGSGSWEKLGDVAATSYRDTTAENGKTYSYTVCCIGSDGSDVSGYDEIGVSIKFVNALREKDIKLKAKKNGVEISWNELENADSYKVLRSIDDGSYKVIAEISKGKELCYFDEAVKEAVKLSYAVLPVTAGIEGAYTGKTFYWLSPVKFEESKVLSDTEVKLFWSENEKADSYELIISKAEDFADYDSMVSQKTVKKIKDLSKKKVYYLKVRACIVKNGVSYYSAWSKVLTVDISAKN